jgi:iron complex outermembrane receptor protein
VFQVYNAGESTMRGVELDVVALPLDDLTVKFSYAYLDAQFDQIDVIPGTIFDNQVNPVSPYRPGDNVKDVFALPFAPEHSVGVGVDYVLANFDNGDLTAHLNWRWQDEVFVTAAAGPAVPGREFAVLPAQNYLDLSLAYAVELPRGDSAKIILWGKNIANRDYPLTGGPAGASFPIQSPTSGLVSPAGYTSFAGSWTPPASYGIQLQYEY